MRQLHTALTIMVVVMFLHADYMLILLMRNQSLERFSIFTAACIWTWIVWWQRKNLKKTYALHGLLKAKAEALDKIMEQMLQPLKEELEQLKTRQNQDKNEGTEA